ncbi:MAG TPA: hypothetical protein VH853_08770 [Polyangia bacterium]|nr:hypothetical protein [Polyangia bacterium]
MFDTETMAELCVRQGLTDQAIGIFRRLAEVAEDPGIRLRYETRISELGRDPVVVPIETPGLRVAERAGAVEIEWRLPPEVAGPALQVLLLRRGPDGIETDPRTLPLGAAQGRTSFAVANLCGVRAAAGRLIDGTFVPLVRFPDRIA